MIGNPTIRSTIRKVTVQSGSPKRGSIISAASMIMKAVAAYMAAALMTFLRFSSCQNREILPGFIDIESFLKEPLGLVLALILTQVT